MAKINKIIAITSLGGVAYAMVYAGFYFLQEKMLFKPTLTPQDFKYPFLNAEELKIPVEKGIKLHSLWFRKAENKKVVFYLHGYRGNMEKIGLLGEHYNALGFDFFSFDYRGYGKSDGSIKSEKQFFEDAQKVLDFVKQYYTNEQIIIVGYSLGSGTATYLSAHNQVNQLFLLAPYYSMLHMKKERNIRFIPDKVLKYPFETNKWIQKVTVPITIFHGKDDVSISYKNSERLHRENPQIDVHWLENQGHSDLALNPILTEIMLQKINKNS